MKGAIGFIKFYCYNIQCVEFVDEKLHQLVASDGSRANATIITTSLGEGNYNLSSLDDGMKSSQDITN